MQRAHVCAGLGIGFMLAASSTYAGQVELSVENRIGGDSNVLRTENPDADGTWDVRAPDSAFVKTAKTSSTGSTTGPPIGISSRLRESTGSTTTRTRRVGWAISPVDEIDVTGLLLQWSQLLRSDIVPGELEHRRPSNDRARFEAIRCDPRLPPRHVASTLAQIDRLFRRLRCTGTKLGSQTDSRAYTGRISARLRSGSADGDRPRRVGTAAREQGSGFRYESISRRFLSDCFVENRRLGCPLLGRRESSRRRSAYRSRPVLPSSDSSSSRAGASDPSRAGRFRPRGVPQRERLRRRFGVEGMEDERRQLLLCPLRGAKWLGLVGILDHRDQIQMNVNHRINDRWAVRASGPGIARAAREPAGHSRSIPRSPTYQMIEHRRIHVEPTDSS